MIGQMLSHYRVVEQIGSGGMGVVYRAHDEQLDRDVALKVITPGTIVDEASRSRFRKEALALAKLDHPNIATVFEFGSQDGIDFLVTAYIPGLTLDAKLASRSLPESEVVALGIQMAKGLTAAHERGVVHCDLKPGNLRLTPDGVPKFLISASLVSSIPAPTPRPSLSLIPREPAAPYPTWRQNSFAPNLLTLAPISGRPERCSTRWPLAFGHSVKSKPAALIHAILNVPPKSPRGSKRPDLCRP